MSYAWPTLNPTKSILGDIGVHSLSQTLVEALELVDVTMQHSSISPKTAPIRYEKARAAVEFAAHDALGIFRDCNMRKAYDLASNDFWRERISNLLVIMEMEPEATQ